MTHRTSADYYAGIPQYGGRINPADLNAAKAAAWDEGNRAGYLEANDEFRQLRIIRAATNPYRAPDVEGMNQ